MHESFDNSLSNCSSSSATSDAITERRWSAVHSSSISQNKTLNRSRRRRSSPSGMTEIDNADVVLRPRASEREMLSRSMSFKTTDDYGSCKSFCPSDIEIKELLGKGCFGEVYKVIHRDTKQIMVLKCLYRVDQKGEQDFLKEAAFMRQLRHPNVVRFFGILYKEKKLHIISEFISGGSLRSCLDANVNLSWSRRLSFAKDIAAGMAYLHSKNIVHRDLTSCNILLRQEDDSAVVADFGLARMLPRRRRSRKRRLTIVGNPYMMAPEMINEQSYDERADVFSYGITLCEIIGRCSVDPDDLPRSKNFGVDREAFLSKFANSCPPPFFEIAFKCASVDPDERPPFRLLFEWLSTLFGAVSVEDISEFDHFVNEIKSFSLNLSNTSECFDESTPVRPSMALGRLSLHRRKISMDLGYDSISPKHRQLECGHSYGESVRNLLTDSEEIAVTGDANSKCAVLGEENSKCFVSDKCNSKVAVPGEESSVKI